MGNECTVTAPGSNPFYGSSASSSRNTRAECRFYLASAVCGSLHCFCAAYFFIRKRPQKLHEIYFRRTPRFISGNKFDGCNSIVARNAHHTVVVVCGKMYNSNFQRRTRSSIITTKLLLMILGDVLICAENSSNASLYSLLAFLLKLFKDLRNVYVFFILKFNESLC